MTKRSTAEAAYKTIDEYLEFTMLSPTDWPTEGRHFLLYDSVTSRSSRKAAISWLIEHEFIKLIDPADGERAYVCTQRMTTYAELRAI